MDWLLIEYFFTYLVFIVGICTIGSLLVSVLLNVLKWIYLKYFSQRFRQKKK
jgi:hypothetical protein